MSSVKIPKSAEQFLELCRTSSTTNSDSEIFFNTQADLLLFAAFLSRKADRNSYMPDSLAENSKKDSIDIKIFEGDGRYPRFLAAAMLHLNSGEGVIKDMDSMCEAIFQASHIGFEYLKKRSEKKDIKNALMELLIEK